MCLCTNVRCAANEDPPRLTAALAPLKRQLNKLTGLVRANCGHDCIKFLQITLCLAMLLDVPFNGSG